MTSSNGHNPLQKKWRIGTREIIYIIAGLLIGIYMLFFFFREIRSEEKFMKHINKEHNHAG
jgi:uncharacterized membrane protein YuzA (DUF378 family)